MGPAFIPHADLNVAREANRFSCFSLVCLFRIRCEMFELVCQNHCPLGQ